MGTWVPGAGACSRAVPLPTISTSRPAADAVSITLRTGMPMSVGTASFLPSLIVTCEGGFCPDLLAIWDVVDESAFCVTADSWFASAVELGADVDDCELPCRSEEQTSEIQS